MQLVKETGNVPVPLHLRNAPTKLMADLGYSDGYIYPHDYPVNTVDANGEPTGKTIGNFAQQQYLPDSLRDIRLWHAQHSPTEEKQYQQMLNLWGERFKD